MSLLALIWRRETAISMVALSNFLGSDRFFVALVFDQSECWRRVGGLALVLCRPWALLSVGYGVIPIWAIRGGSEI